MIVVFALVLGVLSGCYGTTRLNITRQHTDDEGNLVTVTVSDQSATSEAAAMLLESSRQLERTKLDGEAEKRIDQTAKLSVEMGQPTSVTTRGGSVTSGYVGYDPNGMYGQGYYNFGTYGPDAMSPGVSPEAVMAERAARMGGGLPTLGTMVSTGFPAAEMEGSAGVLAVCPTDRDPATMAEQLACNSKDIDELYRVRARAKKK